MNKKINNFSKYLLIASLGFASTQATDRKKEPKRTKETEKIKKLDKIILKEKIVMVGGIFIAIFQGLVFCLAVSVWKNRKKLPFGNSINLGTTNDLLSDALTSQNRGGGFVLVGDGNNENPGPLPYKEVEALDSDIPPNALTPQNGGGDENNEGNTQNFSIFEREYNEQEQEQAPPASF